MDANGDNLVTTGPKRTLYVQLGESQNLCKLLKTKMVRKGGLEPPRPRDTRS